MSSFQAFITNLIAPCTLDSTQQAILTDPLSMQLYTKAFTHVTHDAVNHYEVYEQLGDITVNKFLVWYFHHKLSRYGELFHSTLGVKIVARLRIKYGSKQVLSDLADRLGFWAYIRVGETMSAGRRMSVLEDVFEAFIGVTEYIVDSRLMKGLGYVVCYRILESLFDPIPLDVSYEQLFDAKTRLKELFDVHRDAIGTVTYEYEKVASSGHAQVRVCRIAPDHTRIVLSTATSPINRAYAEQQASETALGVLAQQGFTRDIPTEYRNMLSKVTRDDVIPPATPVPETTRGALW